MKIIDSHFHSQLLKEKGFDLKTFSSFLSGGIDAGCTLEDLKERKNLLAPYPHIKFAAAMGPWCTVEKINENILKDFEEQVSVLQPDFIGETGLDFYHNYGSSQEQKELFVFHMKLANKLNKRVLIHSREAAEETCLVIKSYSPELAGVIHCFDGSPLLLKTALENGFYISFAGNLTYKNNLHLRKIIKKVPLNRLLLETDSPYLAPVPLRGQTNTPLNIIHTYECAAEVLNLSVEKLADIVFENFTCFLSH